MKIIFKLPSTEGFIIIDNTFKNIQKYVRYEDGKATPHISK